MAEVDSAVNPSATQAQARNAALSVFLITFAIVFVTGIFVLRSYASLSPVDELQHLDSIIKAGQGQFNLMPGEVVGQEALRIEACRGVEGGPPLPPCDAPSFPPEQFQEMGINTSAEGIPSPYYILTGILIKPFELLGMNALTAARAVSLAFHALGAGLLALLAWRLSGSRLVAISLGVGAGVCSPLLAQSMTANPDSWSLLVGVGACALAMASSRLRPRTLLALLSLFTVAALLVKLNWVLLALVPLVWCLMGWRLEKNQQLKARIPAVLGALAVSGGALIAASLLSRALASSVTSVAPMGARLAISESNPFDWTVVFNTVATSWVVTGQPAHVDALDHFPLPSLAVVWGVAFAGAAITALLLRSAPFAAQAFGTAAVLLLLGSPLFVFLGQYVSGAFFAFPLRYSFMVVPVMVLALASWPRLRAWALGSLATVTVAATWWATAQV